MSIHDGSPLALYRQSFAHQSRSNGGDLTSEIEVRIGPGQHVAGLTCDLRIPAGPAGRVELLRLMDGGGAGVLTLTNVRCLTDGYSVSVTTHADSILVWAERDQDAAHAHRVLFECRLFGAATKLAGVAPYLTSDLRVRAEVLPSGGLPTMLAVSIPEEASARCTQGNFTLASPSQVFEDRRVTLIHFRGSSIDLLYRFGPTNNLLAPWISLGSVALASLLVFLVLYVSKSVGSGDTYGALAASFVGFAAILWDLSKSVANFSIYGAVRSWMNWSILAVEILALGLTAYAVTALRGNSDTTSNITKVVLLYAFVTGLLTVAGFIAHSRGALQRFQCDQVGCLQVLHLRRGRPECHYTGRVFCDTHIARTCGACIHQRDLGSHHLSTLQQYGSESLPCIPLSSSQRA